jgi:small-conductance mechanosensitive channel
VDEWVAAFARRGERPILASLRDFGTILGAWALAGLVLHEVARRLLRRPARRAADQPDSPHDAEAERHHLPPVPSWMDVGIYMLRKIGPWALAFGLAVLITHRVQLHSPASIAGMVVAYAIVVGAVLSAVCQTLFALFSGAHRRCAVRDLHRHSRGLLFLIGALAALGDATSDARVAAALGINLSALIATTANILAAVLMGWFALRFRRQVGQLIANRPQPFREAHPNITDLLRLVGQAWHLPVLAIVVASVTGTILAAGQADTLLRQTIISVALFVAGVALTAMTSRSPKGSQRALRLRDRQRSVFVARFARFAMALVRVVIWVAFLEFVSRVWGSSLMELMQSTTLGQRIGDAVFSVIGTVLLTWLVWLVADTAIMQGLSPGHGRGPQPSLRAKTILPLVRNALFVGLLVIALIAVLANLGVNVTPLLAGAGVVGLAIGFGAQTLVQDLITGLFIVVEDSMAIGDVIELPDHSGTVESLTIRTVKLRDGKGALHILPYSQIKAVKNLSRGYGVALLSINVSHDSDLDRAMALIRETGDEIASDVRYAHNLLSGLDILGLDRFDPNGPVILAQFKTRPLAQFEVSRAFNAQLKQKFDAAGVHMASPYMKLQMDQGRMPPGLAPEPADTTIVTESGTQSA